MAHALYHYILGNAVVTAVAAAVVAPVPSSSRMLMIVHPMAALGRVLATIALV